VEKQPWSMSWITLPDGSVIVQDAHRWSLAEGKGQPAEGMVKFIQLDADVSRTSVPDVQAADAVAGSQPTVPKYRRAAKR
jgi:hypothetical protein